MDISIFKPFTGLPFFDSFGFAALLGVTITVGFFGLIIFTGALFDRWFQRRRWPVLALVLSVAVLAISGVLVGVQVQDIHHRYDTVHTDFKTQAQQVYGLKLTSNQVRQLLAEQRYDTHDYAVAKNGQQFGSITLLVDGQPSRITLYELHDQLVLYSFGQPRELPHVS